MFVLGDGLSEYDKLYFYKNWQLEGTHLNSLSQTLDDNIKEKNIKMDKFRRVLKMKNRRMEIGGCEGQDR